MLEVTKQGPMNNEYANALISKLSPVTLTAIDHKLTIICIIMFVMTSCGNHQ